MDFSNIINGLKDAVEQLLPFRIVHIYEQGIRWTLGKPGEILKPGLRWYCPIIQEIDVADITCDSLTMEPQAICTGDGQECVVQAGLIYKISNIKKLYCSLQDEEITSGLPTIAVAARGLLATHLGGCGYKEIWKDKELIEENVQREINAVVIKYGLFIVRLYIAEVGQSRNYRIFSSNPTYSMPGLGE